MNILAIDTATEVLSLALETGSGVFYTEIDAGARHSELLVAAAARLCESAGLAPAEIALVGCMKGPGSFTGLRIGFSAAKGLAIALGIPLLTAPTLDCLSANLSIWPGLVLPLIDAKKNSFYAAFYRGGERLTSYMDAAAELLVKEADGLALFPEEPLLLTGPGAELFRSRISEQRVFTHIKIDPGFRGGRAKELLNLLKGSILSGKGDEIDSGPVYLRKSDAELNLSQSRENKNDRTGQHTGG